MRLFKLIASRGPEVIFDDRLTAATPREARERMKSALGLESLSGIVYSITEIPLELIREIVNARLAEATLARADGSPGIDLPALVRAAAEDAVRRSLGDLEARLTRLEAQRGAPAARRFDALAASATPPADQSVAPPAQPQVLSPAEPLEEVVPFGPVPEPAPAPSAPPGPDWPAIQAFYESNGSPKQTAARFGLSLNTVKARIQREGWVSPRSRQPAARA